MANETDGENRMNCPNCGCELVKKKGKVKIAINLIDKQREKE